MADQTGTTNTALTPEAHATAEMAKFTGFAVKDGETIKSRAPKENISADEEAQAENEAAAAETAKSATTKQQTPAERVKAAVAAARGDAPEAAAEGTETEEGTGAEEPEEGEEAPAEEAKPVAAKPKQSAQARIDQAIAKQRAAERRAAELERQLVAGAPASTDRAAPAATVAAATETEEKLPAGLGPKPDPEAYPYKEFDAKYGADLQAWSVRKVLLEDREAQAVSRQTEARNAQVAEVNKKINEMSEAALEKYPDFDQVVVQAGREGKWPLSPQLGELLLNSEHGSDIAYALATDLTEATRVYRLSPLEQAAYFGRMEAHLAGTQSAQTVPKVTVKPSKAPEPPARQARGHGGSSAPLRSDTSDFAAFEKMALQRKG